jgi:hypothetical protein
MATRDRTGSGTKRETCTLSVATVRYLHALSNKGTHGTSVPGVMTTLIEQGVRQAILDRFIPQFQDDDAP